MNIRTVVVHLCAAGCLQTAFGQGLLDGFASNVENVIKPPQSVLGDIGQNIASAADQAGQNIASAADQAGQNAASMASDAIADANSNQQAQISSELSSYHSDANDVHARWLATFAIVAGIHLAF